MRGSLLVAAAVVIFLPAASSLGQELKTAKGTVARIGADSMTIRAGLTEMRFAVDDRTMVEAPGAGTTARRAQWSGRPGPKLSDLLKPGQHVEVGYDESAGAFHAASVRRVSSAGGGIQTKSAGVVAALSGDSLTITGGARSGATFTQTFYIDERTQVTGKGVGTHAAANGGKAMFLELVGLGDRVSVSYRDVAGSLHAADVRVTGKGAR